MARRSLGGLPGFGEIRTKVALTSDDSEISNNARAANVHLAPQCVEGLCTPGFTGPAHLEQWRTVTHADALVTSSSGVSGQAKFPFFTVGFFTAYATLGLSFGLGVPEPSSNTRLQTRTGTLSGAYHDGPWRNFTNVQSAGLFGVWPEAMTDASYYVGSSVESNPFYLKLLENDDHSLRKTTSASLSLGLEGDVGVTVGPAQIEIKLTGGITGTVSETHELRDEALVERDLASPATATPIDAVTIAPLSGAKASLNDTVLSFHAELDLPWPIGAISYDKTLASLPGTSLASYSSGLWPESSRVRLAYGSALGNPMLKPAAYSHFPGSAPFSGISGDVDTCLADPKPSPVEPPACKATPPQGALPSAQVCFWEPVWPGLSCTNYVAAIGAGSAWSPAQKQCLDDLMAYMCSGTSKIQSLNGGHAVAHVIDFSPAGAPAMTSLVHALNECVLSSTTAGVGGADGARIATQYVAGLLQVSACTADGTLLPTPIQTAIDPSAPPPVTEGSCGSGHL